MPPEEVSESRDRAARGRQAEIKGGYSGMVMHGERHRALVCCLHGGSSRPRVRQPPCLTQDSTFTDPPPVGLKATAKKNVTRVPAGPSFSL